MAFKLDNVVPWGRTLNEYIEMFALSEKDLSKSIIGFADGPASFNVEASQRGASVISLDPIYGCDAAAIAQRVLETKDAVLEQTRRNASNYNWNSIQSVEELGEIRMMAMRKFLDDYELGLSQGRYVFHEFPDQTLYDDNSFELGLCSHFLFLYKDLGRDFHLKTLDEMTRLCREVRISPAVDLDGNPSEYIEEAISRYRQRGYTVDIVQTEYAFLKTENQFLSIIKPVI